MLGYKESETVDLYTITPHVQTFSSKQLSYIEFTKKSHKAPGKSSILEYAVVDKSKKNKKRSSLMVYSSQDKDIATTTGVKAGVFHRMFDTFILESIKPKQGTTKQKPASNIPGYTHKFFDSAPTKTVTNINTSPETQQVMDSPFGDEDPCACSKSEAVQLGRNPFTRYETPMVPDQPMEQIDTTNSKAPEITGDCDIDVPRT